jgi:hypothetical protein
MDELMRKKLFYPLTAEILPPFFHIYPLTFFLIALVKRKINNKKTWMKKLLSKNKDTGKRL